jgi:predicted  nucleic acid-binding Zn-ribbon protein
MQTRHRVPTIFNLSMVDVLCCALGCVILLWLLNLKEAKEKSAQAGTTSAQLTAAETELQSARARLAELQNQAAALGSQLDEAMRHAADTTRRLGAAEEDRNQSRKDLANLRAAKADADERLAKKSQEATDVEKRLVAASQRVATLELLVREKETSATAMVKRAADLTEQLTDADARVKKLQGQADRVPDLEKDLKSYRDKLTTEEASAKNRMDDLADARKAAARLERDLDVTSKELTDSRRIVETLQGENKSLEKEATRYRFAVENRFAGIELTGRRVVFLVDMSGSMELVDENTPAPSKWQGVRDTVAKLMRSLPGLEKYQIIIFSEKASFLLGSDQQWLNYDPKTSADRAVQALAAIRPHGGTNMYTALDAAFRFRPVGLDAVYLLSDGLPNLGEGITAEQARTLKETEQGEILGKHIRQMLKNTWNRPLADWPRVRINAVGFFYESPDVGAFLWALARENEGSFVGMSKP